MPLHDCSSPQEVINFIAKAVQLEDQTYRFGYLSPSIYDVAWVSMIRKEVNNHHVWLFPECFDYILRSQLEDGTWECYASPDDGILNTLVSLLTLLVHESADKV